MGTLKRRCSCVTRTASFTSVTCATGETHRVLGHIREDPLRGPFQVQKSSRRNWQGTPTARASMKRQTDGLSGIRPILLLLFSALMKHSREKRDLKIIKQSWMPLFNIRY